MTGAAMDARTKLILPLLAAIVPTAAAHAGCVSLGDWLVDVRHHSVAAKVEIVTDIHGQAAADAVARMNAIPPETHVVADEIAVIGATSATTGAQFSYVLIGYFERGCMVAKQQGDAEVVAAWLLGEGA